MARGAKPSREPALVVSARPGLENGLTLWDKLPIGNVSLRVALNLSDPSPLPLFNGR